MAVKTRDTDRTLAIHRLAWESHEVEAKFRKLASTNKNVRFSGIDKEFAKVNEAIQTWCRDEMAKENYSHEYVDEDGMQVLEPSSFSMDARARQTYDNVLKRMRQDQDRLERQREIGAKIMQRWNPHYRNK